MIVYWNKFGWWWLKIVIEWECLPRCSLHFSCLIFNCFVKIAKWILFEKGSLCCAPRRCFTDLNATIFLCSFSTMFKNLFGFNEKIFWRFFKFASGIVDFCRWRAATSIFELMWKEHIFDRVQLDTLQRNKRQWESNWLQLSGVFLVSIWRYQWNSSFMLCLPSFSAWDRLEWKVSSWNWKVGFCDVLEEKHRAFGLRRSRSCSGSAMMNVFSSLITDWKREETQRFLFRRRTRQKNVEDHLLLIVKKKSFENPVDRNI